MNPAGEMFHRRREEEDATMQEEPTNPLVKEVPGHLFKFEETIWGMTLQQLLTDLGVLTGSITLTGVLPLALRIIVCALLSVGALSLVHGKAQRHPLGFWLYLCLREKPCLLARPGRQGDHLLRPRREHLVEGPL